MKQKAPALHCHNLQRSRTSRIAKQSHVAKHVCLQVQAPSMPKCKEHGCTVTSARRINQDGYCDKHVRSTPAKKSNDDLESRVTKLETENDSLKQLVRDMHHHIVQLYTGMNDMRKAVNVSNYTNDGLEQYGRRETIRLVDLPEEPAKFDKAGKYIQTEDCKDIAIEAADLLGVSLSRNDIQRAHRIGQRKKPSDENPFPKHRQVIIRLKDYDNRCKVISKKKDFQANAKAKGKNKYAKSFITEDLCPSRSTLLWYMKKHCNGNFLQCHTIEGKIKAKVKGGNGNWITVSSPDDLFKYYDEIDIDFLNEKLKKYSILKQVKVPNFEPELPELPIDDSFNSDV